MTELCRPHKIEFHVQGDGGGAMFWSYRVSKGFGYDINIINGSIDLVIYEMSKESVRIILPKYYTFINNTSFGYIYTHSLLL